MSVDEAWKKLGPAESRFAQGIKAFRSGLYTEASEAFESCLREMPRHAYASYYLANIAYIQGDFPRALTHMERSLGDLPFMDELNDHGLKRKSRSIASYEQMLNTEWENAVNCRAAREIESLADEVSTDKTKLELQAAKESASRARRSAHYRYFLGNILFQLKDFPEAARLFREALALDPRHTGAANNAAAICYMAGDLKGALEIIDKSESEGLGDGLNLKLKHLVLEGLGRPTEGILLEDLSSGPEGDLGVVRLALAARSDDPQIPAFYENCYVVFCRTSRQAVLIDPGAEDSRIPELVRTEGLEVKAILNTHFHPDHTAANGRYAALFAAPVIAPQRDAEALPEPPARSFGDGEVLPFEGFSVKTLLTPGHSPGSSCFLIGDFLFTGDTLFKGFIGQVAEESREKAGEEQRRLARTIRDKLLTLDGRLRVCPGHGKTTTIADEAADNPFLRK